jgi:glycosyltransferase involved in cell wall biosynthesis
MEVSVIILAKNEEKFIAQCLNGLSRQSFTDFEIIIIDNGSTDNTKSIIDSKNDRRIKYFYEPGISGMSKLRNYGLLQACGKYIFFTDADCAPTKYWIKEGVRILEQGRYAGVEGKTVYESLQPLTISDSGSSQLKGGEYKTCNIAYERQALAKICNFDPHFRFGLEDRDLAFRVKQFGAICFSEDMLVFHQKKKMSIKALFKEARRAEDIVYFIKKHGSYPRMYKNILSPRDLAIIFCPPLLVFVYSYRSFYDLIFGFFKYLYFIYRRAIIWKTAIRNRIFII